MDRRFDWRVGLRSGFGWERVSQEFERVLEGVLKGGGGFCRSLRRYWISFWREGRLQEFERLLRGVLEGGLL